MQTQKTVLVTGGAGYVGSKLVPRLLENGYKVHVLDLYLFHRKVFEDFRNNPDLVEFLGDIRNPNLLAEALRGCDFVIHLACISNDPSFELDPNLGKSINYDSFRPLVHAAKLGGISRFIYVSSSSVYGIKSDKTVTEDLPLKPLTDYSKYKALCEEILLEERDGDFATTIFRPATVCGYAPRLRLDLTVNILTNHAVHCGAITVLGGSQLRPNIHIDDMVDLYTRCLSYPDALIDGQIFNVGHENYSVLEIAEIVKAEIGTNIEIVRTKTDDSRSYHISSEKISKVLAFVPSRSVANAVNDLLSAFEQGLVPNPLGNPKYFNLETLQNLDLSQVR